VKCKTLFFFKGAMPYGRQLFDAMSNGLATIAVITTPWLNIDDLARAIASLAKNPERQKQMTTPAIEFAKKNTQEYWLNNEDLSEKEPATRIDATADFQNPLNKETDLSV
jgi:hypothetical protein